MITNIMLGFERHIDGGETAQRIGHMVGIQGI